MRYMEEWPGQGSMLDGVLVLSTDLLLCWRVVLSILSYSTWYA